MQSRMSGGLLSAVLRPGVTSIKRCFLLIVVISSSFLLLHSKDLISETFRVLRDNWSSDRNQSIDTSLLLKREIASVQRHSNVKTADSVDNREFVGNAGLVFHSNDVLDRTTKGAIRNETSVYHKKDFITLTKRKSLDSVSKIVKNVEVNEKPQDVCKFPDMDPFHPKVMETFIRNPTIDCQGGIPSLVYVDGLFLRFNETKARLYNITVDQCRYTPLRMKKGDDHYTDDPEWSPPFTKFVQFPKDVENMLTECTHKKRIVSQTFTALVKERKSTEEKCRSKYKRHVEKNSPKETMSVLLVGIDGTSRQNFIRSMPKTRKFIIEQLGAMELFKLNKGGDNTLPNLAALLAGSTMNELRANWSMNDDYFDKIDHMFIWKDFSDAGYRTGFVIDRAIISAFHYQKKGWNHPIFDYRHRPAVAKWDRNRLSRKKSEFCVGDVPEVPHLFDYWLQLTSLFNNSKQQPYFGFSFFCHLTHDDPNLASAGDELYLDFFQNLKKRNVLKNTIVIFYSDHGARFGPLRPTYNGMLESKNPLMFFIFPAWFKEKYPHIMKNFRTNQHRLTTFFDVHATLKNIVNFTGESGKGDWRHKSISLFKEIPSNRPCGNAGISMNYCLCSKTSNMEAPRELWKVVGEVLLDHIVKLTTHVRDKCHPLSLVNVRTVVGLTDTHYRKGREFFRAIIETSPGGAIYEGLMEYTLATKRVRVVSRPTRLNLYRGMAECVDSEEDRLFCACRKLVPT